MREAVAANLSLDETHTLLPHRTRDAVKDQYYRARQPQDRDDPPCVSDIRRQKDAREGSFKLLQALIDAGFAQMQKAG